MGEHKKLSDGREGAGAPRRVMLAAVSAVLALARAMVALAVAVALVWLAAFHVAPALCVTGGRMLGVTTGMDMADLVTLLGAPALVVSVALAVLVCALVGRVWAVLGRVAARARARLAEKMGLAA